MQHADASATGPFRSRGLAWVTAACVALIVALYCKAQNGGFIWDELIYLVDTAWFRVGDEWTHRIFEPFLTSGNYFRPLVLAVIVAEVRGFAGDPLPMHWVNIALHAANTALIIRLAARMLAQRGASNRATLIGVSLLGTIYAAHPAMIEPVAWISCQFDLFVTFFCLVALWADGAIQRKAWRIAVVCALFLCAALSKEAAAVFPGILFIAHWMQGPTSTLTPLQRLRRQLGEQGGMYLALVATGIAYLAIRYWSFGYLVDTSNSAADAPGVRWALPPFLFAKYIQIALWPFSGLGPLHLHPFMGMAWMPGLDFAVAICGAVIGVVGIGLTVARKGAGAMLSLMAVALAPVLQLGGVITGSSVYQERFLAFPLAATLAIGAPVLWMELWPRWRMQPALRFAAAAACAFWLIAAALNVKVTVPLWGNERALWQWVLRDSPDVEYALVNLIGEYVKKGEDAKALPYIHEIEASSDPAPLGLLNSAAAYINLGQLDDANRLLDRAMSTIAPDDSEKLFQLIMLRGAVEKAKKNYPGAIDAYQDAIKVKPSSSNGFRNLAVVLCLAGKKEAAEQAYVEAGRLMLPAARADWRERFAEVQTECGASIPAAPAR